MKIVVIALAVLLVVGGVAWWFRIMTGSPQNLLSTQAADAVARRGGSAAVRLAR